MPEDFRKQQIMAGEEEIRAARRLAEVFTVGRDLASGLRGEVGQELDRPGVDRDRARQLDQVSGTRAQLRRALEVDEVRASQAERDSLQLVRLLDQQINGPGAELAPNDAIGHLGSVLGQLRVALDLAGHHWGDLLREVNRAGVVDPAHIDDAVASDRYRSLVGMQDDLRAAAEHLARAEIYVEQSERAAQEFGTAVTAALWQGLTGSRSPAAAQELPQRAIEGPGRT